MSGPSICPHCGYDLHAAEPVSDGPFAYSLQDGLSVDGRRLDAPPLVHLLLGSLISAKGRMLSRAVLVERMGHDGIDPKSLTATALTHARRAFEGRGHPFPVQTVWGAGLRWDRQARPMRGTRRGIVAGATA